MLKLLSMQNLINKTEKSQEVSSKEVCRTTIINVEKIPCYCSIGIDPEEKKMGQQLLIDVSVDIDSKSAVGSDNINDTFSYVDIYKIVQKVGTSKPHSLIEVLEKI